MTGWAAPWFLRGMPPLPRRLARRCALAAPLLLAGAGLARAQLPVEPVGASVRLTAPLSPHLVWSSDAILRRMALADLESGRMLGVVDGGWGITTGIFSRRRPEFYVPETHYSRGSRGVRTDVVTIYDALTLAPTGEIVIPPKRAMNPLPGANAALSDDDRFLAVFDMTPATSISIVDLERRRFVGEISTPGCGLVYAAGPRRFVMPCADGALLTVALGDDGSELAKRRSAPFFDPGSDPVTEKAVRHGDTWLFVSFAGMVHPVDVSGAEPAFPAPWPLLDDADRRDSWRIGGSQHLALHQKTGRLYSLVHQGGPDTHKDPGTELWVYDLASRQRVQRIRMHNPGLTYLGQPMEFGADWIWPFSHLYDWLLDMLGAKLGVGEVAVTQDDHPLLVTGSNFSGSVGVYDALSGELLRRIAVGNMTTLALAVPWQTLEATR